MIDKLSVTILIWKGVNFLFSKKVQESVRRIEKQALSQSQLAPVNFYQKSATPSNSSQAQSLFRLVCPLHTVTQIQTVPSR